MMRENHLELISGVKPGCHAPLDFSVYKNKVMKEGKMDEYEQ